MKDNTILKSFFILIMSSIIIILVAFWGSKLEKTSMINEDVTSYTNGWHSTKKDKSIPFPIPSKVTLPENSTFRISNTLPAKYVEGMSLSICTSYPNFRVYVDRIKVYEYGYDKKFLFGQASGSNYHIIRLPWNTNSKTITLEFNSFGKPLEGKISTLTIGSKVANVSTIVQHHLAPFILCILIILIGILFIVLYFYMNLKFKEGKSLLYLGLFSIVVSIWSATETKMIQFVLPYQYIEDIITFLSLMLCPIPFLLFLKGASHSSKSKGFNILCTLLIVNFMTANLLTFLGLSNYRDMLIFTHFFILVTIIFSCYTLAKEVFFYRSKDAYFLGISNLVLGIFAFFDFVRYYINNTVDASYYFRIGLLLFITLTGLSTFKKMVAMIKMGLNMSAIHKLAYIDILTKIKNRTAYVNELDELNKTLSPVSNIIVVMFDLNNLKIANDTFGHETGDTLIVAAADCIKKALGEYGNCYRIGGDEFAAIMINVYTPYFLQCTTDLDRMIKNYNEINTIKLEIPYGYTHYDPELDKDLYGTFSRADTLMYEAKSAMKANKTLHKN